MRTPLVEVGNIFNQHPTQVAFTEDENVIQALLPDRSHPALGNGIGLRRPKRDTNLSDSEAFQASIEERGRVVSRPGGVATRRSRSYWRRALLFPSHRHRATAKREVLGAARRDQFRPAAARARQARCGPRSPRTNLRLVYRGLRYAPSA